MKSYTTAQIAKIMNVHPNTVILYEKWGHIEKVKRKPNGYRVFTERHLEQMILARMLIKGDIIKIEFRMKAIEIIEAVVEDDNLELAINRAKNYLKYIQNDISNDTIVIKESLERVKNTRLDNHNSYFKTNQIAKKIGVTNDILIYWERNGLLDISRNKNNKYRVYSEKDLIMVTFIKALRDLHYTSSAIYKLINTVELSDKKTLRQVIYNSDDECEIVDAFNKLLEPIKEIELNINEVIQYIQMMIKERWRNKMKDEFIYLRGCRENNLKNVSLEIPKRKITIFTGVSGSGKSSIVFDTIAKEAQRQLNETFSAFIRNFLPKYGEVKADHIENLSTPIIIDQSRIGGNSRSTLGTITDINSFLRTLYSRFGSTYIGKANMFSFNDINGMCPECEGLGKKLVPNMEEILDMNKTLNEGAILLSGFGVDSWHWRLFAESGFFDNNKRICDYSKDELEKFLYGAPEKIIIEGAGTTKLTYEGLMVKFNRLYLKKEGEISESAKKKLSKLLIEGECQLCKGRRLHERVYGCLINGYNIADLTSMQVDELVKVIQDIKERDAEPLVKGIVGKLNNIIDIGLGYLTLDRETSSLSGGESQRIKMVKHLNSNLIDLMYIFDEPSIGLHPRDVHKLNNLLRKLRDKGNTVIVVEHDPDVIKIADNIIDVGPLAGRNGGEIVYQGSYEKLLESGTLTGNALKKNLFIKEDVREHKGYLKAVNCKKNNLKNISVNIPEGVLTVVTGVAGSGKSTLIKHEFLKQNKEVVLIDQSPVGANSRSSLATYSGIMDNIRKVFAKENGVNLSLFSSNSEGACENCKGSGVIETNLAFMDNIKSTCDVCEGKKFKKEVLDYKFHGKNIVEVLDMTVLEAIEFFNLKAIKTKLQSIADMGIGYLTLGQTLDTLSGGECQRLKLASELHKESSVYIMDEPTTGLHMADIEKFINIVESIVDNGNTVIIIEHNIDVIKRADWIIDLGPDGGTKGGEIIFEGTPSELKFCKESLTAKYI